MTRNELIAKVALDFIKQQLESEDEGTLRFCMVGLDENVVVEIAQAALSDNWIKGLVNVRIPTAFGRLGSLPPETISDESITHWRHCRLEGGKHGVLFAASHEELQRNDRSVEKITRIETDRLRELYPFWTEGVGLTAEQLDQKKQEHLRAALQAANETHAARTIETFANFVLGIAD